MTSVPAWLFPLWMDVETAIAASRMSKQPLCSCTLLHDLPACSDMICADLRCHTQVSLNFGLITNLDIGTEHMRCDSKSLSMKAKALKPQSPKANRARGRSG